MILSVKIMFSEHDLKKKKMLNPLISNNFKISLNQIFIIKII